MTLSWDLFVLLFISIVVVYSVLLGRNRIVGILVNTYIALTVTLVTGDMVYNFFSSLSIISNRFSITEFAVKTIFLVALTGILSIKSEIAGLDSGGTVSKLQAGVYGFLASCFILSTVFSFMTTSQVIALDSNFVNIISSYYVVFVVAPIGFMVGTSFVKKF